MSMRIWHQSFTVLEDLPPYADAMASHAKKILRPDSELVLHGQMRGTYPGNYPGDDIGFGYTYWIHGNQWIAAARQAEREGFDAYAMCTLPNPMLRESRAMVDIPVIGLGESVFHMAPMYGQRFGVFLFIDRMIPLYREQMQQYGLEARCGAIKPSGLVFKDVLTGFADPAPVIARFMEAARKMIRDDGVDVIIPGEVPMNMLLACNGITRVDDVPIMDSFAMTLKMTELMVDMKRATGILPSRHGWMNSVPSKERLDQVASFYGVDRLKF